MKKVKITLLVGNFILLGILICTYFLGMPEDKNNEVLDNPIVDEPTVLSSVDESLYIDYTNYKRSDNNYEEDILNNNGELYKLIKVNIDDYESFMLVVYDASHVRLALSSGMKTSDNRGKETLKDILKRNNAVAGINGGRFVDMGKYTTDEPIGYVIKDGKILWNNGNKKSELIGFTYDNKLTLVTATGEEALKMGMRDAIEFGPNLIVDGKVNQVAWNKTYRASRAVIAQREDGIVLMLATNGGAACGPKMSSIITLLQKYGAVNAANLDGGASTQLVINNELVTSAKTVQGNVIKNGRRIINGWGVFAD